MSIRKVLESQPFLITANVLSGILAVVILGLVSDNLSYVHSNGAKNGESLIGFNVTVNDTLLYDQATVSHLPADLRTGSYWLMLAAGIGGFLDAALLGGLLCWRRLKSASLQVEHGQTYDRNLNPQTPLAIFIAVAGFARSLAATIYAFQEWSASGTFQPAVYLPLQHGKYDRDFFTPDAWNCQYEDYIIAGNESVRIENLCTEGTAARTMTLALAVLNAFVLYAVVYRSYMRKRGAQVSRQFQGFDQNMTMTSESTVVPSMEERKVAEK